MPRHIIAKDECDNILGVVPLYLKRFRISVFLQYFLSFHLGFICLLFSYLLTWICSHSSGEFVFDYSWADAYYSYGSRYYPKLQCCVPFTPVTGQRILVRNNSYKDQVFDSLVSAMKDMTAKVFDDSNGFLLNCFMVLFVNVCQVICIHSNC